MLMMLMLACGEEPDGDSGVALPEDSGADTEDTGEPSFTPPCDGSWGWAEDRMDVDRLIHVAPMAAGDGSKELPVGTVEEALQLARERGAPGLMIWPGTHDVSDLQLSTSAGDGPGFTVCGCGADSVLAGGSENATLWISNLQATVAAVALTGGYRGLVVRGGAEVTVESVSITDAARVGLIVDGSGTTASLSQVDIAGVVPDEDLGYGLAIQGAAVTVDNLHIIGSHGIGAFVHEAEVDISGLTVEDTVARSDGLLGRGLHMQQLSSGTLSAVTLKGNQDAGLFALQSVGLVVDNLHIDTTSTGFTEDEQTTGDGLVVSAGDSGVNPETYSVVLSDNLVENADRAGILLDGVSATVNGNVVSDCGLTGEGGEGILLQGGAIATGTDQAANVTAELGLNVQVLDVDVVD